MTTTMSAAKVELAFGARVRAVRVASGRTQDEVARAANVSRTAVGNLEAGAGSSLATVTKVLRVLDRTAWLLSLEVPEEAFNPLDLLAQHHSGRLRGAARVRRGPKQGSEASAGGLPTG